MPEPRPTAASSRPTMRDVAAHAGVSLKTVSRVVNKEPGVSEDLVSRVNRAAAELNYRPDLGAGNLRRSGRRTSALGLLLSSVDNAFDASIHRAVEDVATSHAVTVLAASTDEVPEREQRMAEAFTGRRVDGLIVMPTGADQTYLEPELALGTPVVTIDRPPVGIAMDSIVSDNVGGAFRGVDHLLEHGHRRIAFLGDFARIATTQQRLDGGRDALRRRGLEMDPSLVVEGLHDEYGAAVTTIRLLDSADPPTAVFAARNAITTGVLRGLRVHGSLGQIALVGFDDFAHADLLDPAVTVVAQDPVAIGRIAAQRIFARLADRSLPVETVTVPTELRIRRSCGCTVDRSAEFSRYSR